MIFFISIRKIGPWLKAERMIGAYDRRVMYAERHFTKRIAEKFLEGVISRIPEGEEYKAYRESLCVIELETKDPYRTAFAVISDKDSVRLGDISEEESSNLVFYILPKGSGDQSQVLDLLVKNSPWTIDTLPDFVDPKASFVVHRMVTNGEVEDTRSRIRKMISGNKDEFARLGFRWNRDESSNLKGLESLPDFMSIALRTEFGIMADHKPHWRPALIDAIKSLKKTITQDKELKKIFEDPGYRNHLKSIPRGNKMKKSEFLSEAKNFQKVIRGK